MKNRNTMLKQISTETKKKTTNRITNEQPQQNIKQNLDCDILTHDMECNTTYFN